MAMAAVEELAKQVLRSIEGLHVRMEAILSEMEGDVREEWRARFNTEAQSLARVTSPSPALRRSTDLVQPETPTEPEQPPAS